MNRRPMVLLRLALLILCALPLAQARAQSYPNGPVRVIVPFPPGAGVDIVTRLIATKLSTVMGQNFFVENRSGASGTIGAAYAARAKPDGYTLLAAPSSLATSESLYRNPSFKLEKDFNGIAMLASVPFILVTNPKVPANSVAELIALAKAKPNTLTFASTGYGSSPDIAAAQFEMQAHVKLTQVPYRGTAPAMQDLISGRVNLMFANAVSVLPQIKDGLLKGLAVTSAQRSATVPDLPTVAQSGLPGYQADTWFALVAPRGTPAPIIARLNAAVTKVLQMPDVQQVLRAQGATTRTTSPQQVDAYMSSQVKLFAHIVKRAHITIN